MVPNTHDDISAVARALFAEHADEAHLVAARVADRFLADGDLIQAKFFTGVATACIELILNQ